MHRVSGYRGKISTFDILIHSYCWASTLSRAEITFFCVRIQTKRFSKAKFGVLKCTIFIWIGCILVITRVARRTDTVERLTNECLIKDECPWWIDDELHRNRWGIIERYGHKDLIRRRPDSNLTLLAPVLLNELHGCIPSLILEVVLHLTGLCCERISRKNDSVWRNSNSKGCKIFMEYVCRTVQYML